MAEPLSVNNRPIAVLDHSQIAKYLNSIVERGFIEIPEAFSVELIDRINSLIEGPFNCPTINGKRGYVQQSNSRFLYQTLSWGREIIDLYTDPAIIELADRYTQDEVHLSNYRIYRTFPSPHERMHWHIDNKIDTYDYEKEQFETLVVEQDKGIILILYLSDVEDGGFQVVEKSHKWGLDRESWDNQEEEFADKVVTFNDRKRGTAILYDYRCIHRAKPYSRGAIRTSLFAQYSPKRMPVGEPILLNVRDISDLSQVQRRVLNFGQAPTTENWPIGDPKEIFGALGINLEKQRLRFPSSLISKIKRNA